MIKHTSTFLKIELIKKLTDSLNKLISNLLFAETRFGRFVFADAATMERIKRNCDVRKELPNQTMNLLLPSCFFLNSRPKLTNYT